MKREQAPSERRKAIIQVVRAPLDANVIYVLMLVCKRVKQKIIKVCLINGCPSFGIIGSARLKLYIGNTY